MHRFFCDSQNITSQHIQILDKDEWHHLKNVLCLKINEKVAVIDGKGREFICSINNIGKDFVKLNIIEKREIEKEKQALRLTVACALPKKSKIDFIVEKLTEIGVEKIILLKTERTEVNLKDILKKISKLKNIAKSALKQSGNLFMPEIEFLEFSGLLKFKMNDDFDIALIPNLSDSSLSLKEALEKILAKKILLAIGPEGDFSQNELRLAKEAGFTSVSLGANVLRVDTAALVSAGFIKLYFK
jgi:16S rRNA (uracil1498-N3)-methyltransferase